MFLTTLFQVWLPDERNAWAGIIGAIALIAIAARAIHLLAPLLVLFEFIKMYFRCP